MFIQILMFFACIINISKDLSNIPYITSKLRKINIQKRNPYKRTFRHNFQLEHNIQFLWLKLETLKPPLSFYVAIKVFLNVKILLFCSEQLWVATYTIEIIIHFLSFTHVLIKKCCYLVTVAVTKFLRVGLNRVIHKELIDT